MFNFKIFRTNSSEIRTFLSSANEVRGRSFMTSATLGGGGGQSKSDILLTDAEGGVSKVADTKLYFV